MALKLRLARGGTKKRPYYRIVVADVRSPRDGRFIERLGTYDPLLPKDDGARVKLDNERIAHWLSVGAVPTDRVNRFLDAAGLLKREARNNPEKGKPGKKALERLEAQRQAEVDAKAAAEAEKEAAAEAEKEAAAEAEKEAAAEAAKAAAAAAEAPAEEAPAEEAPAEAAPAEEAPAEEAPVEETPAEETPAADEGEKTDA